MRKQGDNPPPIPNRPALSPGSRLGACMGRRSPGSRLGAFIGIQPQPKWPARGASGLRAESMRHSAKTSVASAVVMTPRRMCRIRTSPSPIVSR